MVHNYKGVEDSQAFNYVVNRLRTFCLSQWLIINYNSAKISVLVEEIINYGNKKDQQ